MKTLKQLIKDALTEALLEDQNDIDSIANRLANELVDVRPKPEPSRQYYKRTTAIHNNGYDSYRVEIDAACDKAEAQLIGSDTQYPNIHLPLIDLDFEAQLIESKTKGHYHLYLNKPLKWSKYKKLLRALYRADLINRGWYNYSINKRRTMLWISK